MVKKPNWNSHLCREPRGLLRRSCGRGGRRTSSYEQQKKDKTAGGKERTAVKNQSFKCVSPCDTSATLTAVWLSVSTLKGIKDGESISRCEIFNRKQSKLALKSCRKHFSFFTQPLFVRITTELFRCLIHIQFPIQNSHFINTRQHHIPTWL